MQNEPLSYQKLTPECQLDALAGIGIYPETGLLALNSYENRVYSFSDELNFIALDAGASNSY
mgnify:CR=1 FL=1